MKFISLFAGIGGFDLGLQQAGLTPVAHAEIDKYASMVLQTHWPAVDNLGDVRNVKKSEIGAVDLICGGFPCQDLSVAGKRAGLAGERSGMWHEFHRIIAEFRPRWVVIENVPGLLSSNKGRDMGIIIGALAKLRYGYAYRVLDAQFFGVAQRRRRVFIVANSTDYHYPAKILFEPESCERDIAPSREAGQEISGTLGNRIARSRTELDGHVAYVPQPYGIANTLTKHMHKGINSSVDEGQTPVLGFIPRKTNMTIGEGIVPTLHAGGGGQSDPAICWHNHQQDGSVRIQGDTSPTMSKHWGTGGNNVPMVGVRRLTPLECERLQGFPDGWTEGHSDTQRYKMLGNAIAVPVAEWIARRIAAVSSLTRHGFDRGYAPEEPAP